MIEQDEERPRVRSYLMRRKERNIGTYESGLYVRNMMTNQDETEEYVNVVDKRYSQTPDLTRSMKTRRKWAKSLKKQEVNEKADIFFQEDEPPIQQIQVKLQKPRQQTPQKHVTAPQKDVSTPSPPNSPQKQSFFSLLNNCKSLANINNLVNSLQKAPFTQFRLVRHFSSIHDRFILYSINPQQTSDKKFLLSSYKKVNIKQTIYNISTIDYENIESDDYQAGRMTSDFSRNLYKINGKNNRSIKVRYDDVLFGSRQVCMEIYDGKDKKETFWNIAPHNTVLFDKEMQASKRNIMLARSLPLKQMNPSDIVLKLKKVSRDSYTIRITRQLTPVQAFCFIVSHLDRLA